MKALICLAVIIVIWKKLKIKQKEKRKMIKMINKIQKGT